MTLAARVARLERDVPTPPTEDLVVVTDEDRRLARRLLADRRAYRAASIVTKAWESVLPERRIGHWWGEVMRANPKVRAAELEFSAWCRKARAEDKV